MGVKNEDLRDLIVTTLEDLPKQKFEVMWDHTDYEFCRIYQKERMVIDGGESITRYVMLDPGGNARYRRAFDTDEPSIVNKMKKINVPWCQLGTHYSWDVIELLRNRNSSKGIIDLIKSRRTSELWGLANLIEEKAWITPESSGDDLHPYGVPYYLNMVDADSVVGGFVGQTIRFQDTTTSTTCAGLNANTETKWKNYADVYTDIDNAFLRTMRKAFVKTKFKVPSIVTNPADEKVAAKRGYCDDDTVIKLMELADQRDDNHTPADLMGKVMISNSESGLVYINRIPFINVTELNNVTDPETSDEPAPIYVVDFSKFKPFIQDGYWMKEGDPITQSGQHTTFTVYLDGSHQNLCTNRRQAGFVIHKALTS